jgi:hypothetical protein
MVRREVNADTTESDAAQRQGVEHFVVFQNKLKRIAGAFA